MIRFFHALPRASRRDLEALAASDLRFGEDAAAERAAGGPEPGRDDKAGAS